MGRFDDCFIRTFGYHYEERDGQIVKIYADEKKQRRHDAYKNSGRAAAYKDGCSYTLYPEKNYYYEWDIMGPENNGTFKYGRVYDEYIDWMPTANMQDIMDSYKESLIGQV